MTGSARRRDVVGRLAAGRRRERRVGVPRGKGRRLLHPDVALLEPFPFAVGDLAQPVLEDGLEPGGPRGRLGRLAGTKFRAAVERDRSERGGRPPDPVRLEPTVVGQRGIEVAAEDALGGLRRITVADQVNREHTAIVSAPNGSRRQIGGERAHVRGGARDQIGVAREVDGEAGPRLE